MTNLSIAIIGLATILNSITIIRLTRLTRRTNGRLRYPTRNDNHPDVTHGTRF